MNDTQVTTAQRHKPHMRAIHDALADFEKRELEFRAKERRERIMQIAQIRHSSGPTEQTTARAATR
jgi:hypothetical protein